MIEINLLPGAGKKKASRKAGASVNFAALTQRLSGSVKDKFLAAAVGAVVLAAAGIFGLYTYQDHRADNLATLDKKARDDSSHYAAVVADKQRSEAKRDTLLRELNIIKSIDNDRFVWPHVLDEVSRAMPPYTWLTNVAIAGTPQGSSNIAATPAKKAGEKSDAKKKSASRLDTNVPKDSVRIRIQGRTVDIQALTRFMKDLESSPFLGEVQLEKSEMVIEGGQQVTQFSLSLAYQRPDSASIRRVALGGEVK